MAYSEDEQNAIKKIFETKRFQEGMIVPALENMAAYIFKGEHIYKDYADSALQTAKKPNAEKILQYLENWISSSPTAEIQFNRLDPMQQQRLTEFRDQLKISIDKPTLPRTSTPTPAPTTSPAAITSNFARLRQQGKSTPYLPAKPNSLIDNEQILNQINTRLNEVKKEIKGFRKGHNERLFALKEILAEIEKDPDYKNNKKIINLDDIENKIKVKYQNDPNNKNKFEVGVQPESSSLKTKGEPSQYQLMKNQIKKQSEPDQSENKTKRPGKH